MERDGPGPAATVDDLRRTASPRPELIAYYQAPKPAMRLVPASRWRDWMEATSLRFANRCLPLLMANESGWALLNGQAFEVTWSGSDHASGLTVEYAAEPPPVGERAHSLFGYGVLSFRIPYLFRTTPGWNLLVRGPANWPKDGACALEGLVETDWAVSTFTMNWKLTRPATVAFEAGEPICIIVPQRRGELEAFCPALRDAAQNAEIDSGWRAFQRNRHEIQLRKFIAEYAPGRQDDRDGWEQDYFRGTTPEGHPAAVHQTKLRLAEFG
jgi:hypothetical protein